MSLYTFDSFGDLVDEIHRRHTDSEHREAFEDFIGVLERFHASLFAAEQSPSGEKWHPLAPSTIARKGHGRILFDQGELEASLAVANHGIRDADGLWMTFGSDVEHSFFHQHGTKKLPKREHVGMNEEVVEELTVGIADSLVDQLVDGF